MISYPAARYWKIWTFIISALIGLVVFNTSGWEIFILFVTISGLIMRIIGISIARLRLAAYISKSFRSHDNGIDWIDPETKGCTVGLPEPLQGHALTIVAFVYQKDDCSQITVNFNKPRFTLNDENMRVVEEMCAAALWNILPAWSKWLWPETGSWIKNSKWNGKYGIIFRLPKLLPFQSLMEK